MVIPPRSLVSGSSRKRKRGTEITSSNAQNQPISGRREESLVKRRRVELKHAVSSKFRVAHPPRPNRALTFDIPTHVLSLTNSITPGANSPATVKTKEDGRSRGSNALQSRGSDGIVHPLVALSRINVLLIGINRRNKNQHRNQPFFKHFSILRRCVNMLIKLHEQSVKLAELTPGNANNQHSATSTRQKFEEEFRLQNQREILETHIRERVVPAAYVTFSGLVADTQFANLGVVLVGLLTDVIGVVGEMKTVDRRGQFRPKVNEFQDTDTSMDWLSGRFFGKSTLMTGPDQGMVVERIYDSDHGVISEIDVGVGEKSSKGGTKTMEFDLGEVVQRGNTIKRRDKGLSKSTENEPKSIVAQQVKSDDELGEAEEALENERITIMNIAAGSVTTPAQEHKHNADHTSRDFYNLVEESNKTPEALLEGSLNHVLSDPEENKINPVQARHISKAKAATADKNNNVASLEPQLKSHSAVSPSKQPISSTAPPLSKVASNQAVSSSSSKTPQQKKDKHKETDKDEIKKKKKRKNVIDDLFSGFG